MSIRIIASLINVIIALMPTLIGIYKLVSSVDSTRDKAAKKELVTELTRSDTPVIIKGRMLSPHNISTIIDFLVLAKNIIRRVP